MYVILICRPPAKLDFVDHVVGNQPESGMVPAADWYVQICVTRQFANTPFEDWCFTYHSELTNQPTSQITHSMEQRPSQDVHNCLLKQVNAVHSLTFYFLNIHFNITSISSSKWSCRFSNQNVVIHLLPSCALCVQPAVIDGSYSAFNYTLSVNSTHWSLDTNLLN